MSRPQRLRGLDYVGPAVYFLTLCTRRRQLAFSDAEAVASTLAQFRRTAMLEGFVILAYCIMPDHAHLLIEAIGPKSDLQRFVKLAKQRSGSLYSRTRCRPLWQEGYFERILREGDDTRTVARYILNNPVRAGIVERPGDYPHSGSDVWTLAELLESVR